MASTPAERKRLQRRRDRIDPDRKHRKLDTIEMFGEVGISIINDGNDIWFKAVDLARALEMEDPNGSVSHNINKKYSETYENLAAKNFQYRDIPNLQPKTTFVNETGMNMFVVRSRKPNAELFTEWVCGTVLPSIRRTNKFEVDPAKNPYKELNELMKIQIDELKDKNVNLENKNVNLESKKEQLETQTKELIGDLREYTQQLFKMKASCVPTLNNETKKEYFVLYRLDSDDPMNYYACRVQLESLDQRRNELLEKYPNLEKLKQFLVPNSVAFFNFILEQMPKYIVRGKGQSFGICGISEKEMLTMIENLHRTLHGVQED